MSSFPHRSTLAPFSGLALTLGCGRDSNGPTECSGAVELTVSTAPSPVISWRQTCLVSMIRVAPTSASDNTRWQVFSSDSSNSLESPQTHGQAPDGAHMTGTLAPLESGVTYTASVFLKDGPGSYGLIGIVQFTP